MDSFLVFILMGLVAAMVLFGTQQRPSSPQIIYVPIDSPENSVGLGCLPILAIGLAVILFLYLGGS